MENKQKFYLPEIFLFIITFFYVFFMGVDRHWSSTFDQELTLTYEALLFISGEKQEYFDHPGFFTIFFLSIFFKLMNFFQLLSINSIENLNLSNNFSGSLQELIFYTRIYSGICCFLFLLFFLKFINYLTKDKIVSLLITMCLFFSYGYLFHVTRLRTELLSSMFFFISLFYLIKFYNKDGYTTNKYLFLFFIFLYSAIITKVQILFYAPFFFLISVFAIKNKNKLNDFNMRIFSFQSYKLFFLYIFIFFSLFFFTTDFSSLLIVLMFLVYLNSLFFLYSKYFREGNLI